MKKIFLLSALVLSQFSFGQYYYLEYSGDTPNSLNQDPAYPVGSGQVSGWTSLLGPSVTSPTWSTDESIPFTFEFNGSVEANYKVSSTGVLTFTTSAGAAPSATPSALPNAGIPDKSIALWGLNAEGTNDNVSTKTFGTAPNRQHWIHFSSCTNGSIGWSYWSIVLEETTNNIYLVDQRNTSGTGALSAGIQIDGTTAISVAGSPNLDVTAGGDFNSDDDHYYQFIFGPQPADEIELLSLDLEPVLAEGANNVSGTVQNNGSSTITSFTVDWNDGTSHSEVITQNIASGATYYFTHPTQMNLTAGTSINLDVCATVTGDANTSNDCISSSHDVASQLGTRMPLIELFTSSTCPPCYTLNYSGFGGSGLNTYLTSANANNETNAEVAIIKYQVDWPGNGDHSYNPDAESRISYYNPPGAPSLRLDGELGAGQPSDVTAAAAEPTFMDIAASHTWNGDELTVNVTIDPYLTANGVKLHIALLDKQYDAGTDASFSNGETEFHHVMRKMLPNGNGQTINLTSGTQYTDTETYNSTIVASGLPAQGSYDLHIGSEREVVVFVQDENNDKILNSAISVESESSGLNNSGTGTKLSIYPNPSNGEVNLAFTLANSEKVSFFVTDLTGKVVVNSEESTLPSGFHKYQVDGKTLNDGVYFINLLVGEEKVTKKLVIHK